MKKNSKSKKLFIALSVIPSFILFFVFMIIPTLNVFWMSLFKWGGLTNNKKFVGLNNFIILFKDEKFIKSFQNTLFLIVFVTIVTLILAIALAIAKDVRTAVCVAPAMMTKASSFLYSSETDKVTFD